MRQPVLNIGKSKEATTLTFVLLPQTLCLPNPAPWAQGLPRPRPAPRPARAVPGPGRRPLRGPAAAGRPLLAAGGCARRERAQPPHSRCLATEARPACGSGCPRCSPKAPLPPLQVSQLRFWILIPWFKTQMRINFRDQTRKRPDDWLKGGEGKVS